jgi:tRNA pseudouridine32 synthase / 23S rRNA pseudouridine746 synthase
MRPSSRLRPATRDGVSPSYVGLPVGPWRTVIDFLVERFPTISRQTWEQRMTQGDVIDERGDRITPTSIYRLDALIYYYRHLDHEEHIPFHETIVFQDEHIVVADKPHFLPVMPAGKYLQQTLLVRLKNTLNIDDLVPAHRIDQDTAGLVIFTTHIEARRRYARLFRERQINKEYEAIAGVNTSLSLPMTYRSRLVESEPFMKMQTVPGEPNAETHIELIETRSSLGRYRLNPVTGKKHQLRVQLCELGIPILNDRLYPALHPTTELKAVFDKPLQLLAKSVEFIDPFTNEVRHFASQRTLMW